MTAPVILVAGLLFAMLLLRPSGASWSSIDYGGVWKPVHYGVARAFADVTLSVQHDLQEDIITVSARGPALPGNCIWFLQAQHMQLLGDCFGTCNCLETVLGHSRTRCCM